jgi:hypothetical protein
VGHAAAALLIIAQPLVVLGAVLLPPVVMARQRFAPLALALWFVALGLLTVWGVVTHRTAADADVDADLLGTAHWLGLAAVAAVASMATARRIGSPR